MIGTQPDTRAVPGVQRGDDWGHHPMTAPTIAACPADDEAFDRWDDELTPDAAADAAEEQPAVVAARNFVYHEIRRKLAELGIPPHEVAFIQEHATKAKRAALFAALRRGDVRVLIASKQTTGMNIQDRLIALHHLDAPWRPGDVEQRDGRILRQGNLWPNVYIFTYVTEQSFDAYLWQILETKARFIQQMRSGSVTMRELDDVGEAVLSAAEIKAIASGNPKIMRKVELDSERVRLESLAASFRSDQQRLRVQQRELAYKLPELRERVAFLETVRERSAVEAGTPWTATLRTSLKDTAEQTFAKREAAGAHLRSLMAEAEATHQKLSVGRDEYLGTYRGLHLRLLTRSDRERIALALAYWDGQRSTLIGDQGLSYETDQGVWQSADWQIRDVRDAITKTTERIALLEAEAPKIEAALAAPWPQADTLRAVLAELAVLDAELNAPSPTEPSDLASGDAPIAVAHPVVAPPLMLPPVVFPLPHDPDAMQAALRRLAGMSNEAGDEEAPMGAAEAEPTEETAAAPCEVFEDEPPPLVLEAEGVPEPLPAICEVVVTPKRRTKQQPESRTVVQFSFF